MLALFDTHAHIQDPQFDGDRRDVIQRARDAGLSGVLVLGVDVDTSQQAVDLARANEGFVFAAAGCHPHDADGLDDAGRAALRELAAQPDVVCVGEIGLDFYRDLSGRQQQVDVFQWQLDLARELDKPVAIHCRDAGDEMLPIIDAWASDRSGSAGNAVGGLGHNAPLGVMHYFSGDALLAEHYASLGFMISIHTSITYPKSETLREVARAIPLESLVVETDSPYGAPQSMRGKRNEPARVLAGVEAVAELRGEPVERVAEATTANALRLFRMTSRLTQPVGNEAGS